ncbi:MAG: amino acid ABC transporter permease [Limnochordia bacterium]|jgi:polar amino acid transport system permease protein|nr:amino acid ABC transporter permease [Bacillota bacterium]
MEVVLRVTPHLIQGIYLTLYLSIAGMVLSLLVGFIGGMIRSARVPLLSALWGVHVAFVRGTPFLLLIFIIYYVLPAFGLRLGAQSSGVLGLVLHEGAYMTEIVKGGIDAVDRGQDEAAKALGLTYMQKMRHVILPQAIRLILPPLAGQFVLLVKATSVVSLIGITEVTRVGQQLTQRGEHTFVTFGMVALFYFLICYPLVRFSDQMERKFSKWLETA